MIDCELSGLRIVVLAAGFSSRLGQPKSLTRIHGTSLLRRTILVLEQVTRHKIIVVTPPRAPRMLTELRGRRVSLIANRNRAKGLSSSVLLGLRAGRHGSGVLFLPVDLPDLSRIDVGRLIWRWCGAKRRVAANTVAGRASTPLILPKHLYAQAQRISGDIGFRDLVAGLRPEQIVLLDLPSSARDVDTPPGLAEARRRVRATSRL